MKKKYIAPEFLPEKFQLNSNIAAGCSVTVNVAPADGVSYAQACDDYLAPGDDWYWQNRQVLEDVPYGALQQNADGTVTVEDCYYTAGTMPLATS